MITENNVMGMELNQESKQSPKRKAKMGRPKKHPSMLERNTAIVLAERGMSIAEIGRRLGRDRGTIAAIVKDARGELESYAMQAVHDLTTASAIGALKGDGTWALKILEKVGVVETERQKDDSGGIHIAIGVTLPGLPNANGPIANRGLVPLAGESVEAEEVQRVTKDSND
jgi:hypothetical protein